MRNDNFGAFILTHGRPDRVRTYQTLRDHGYTGPIWLVIDDEDQTADAYRKEFGDQVLTFSKSEIAETFDEADNFIDRRAIVYARNACFDLAESVGCEAFLQLDDDYTGFFYRFDADHMYGPGWSVRSLDDLFDAMVDYHATIPAPTIAFSQGGDHIGGGENNWLRSITFKRKAMNTFFCRTDRRFQFVGRVNEDVNTYVSRGLRGELLFSFMSVQVNQLATQTNAGGMTELYLDGGTYRKSFYSVMFAPSCVKIAKMGRYNFRIHHRVRWKNAAAMVLRESHRKAS